MPKKKQNVYLREKPLSHGNKSLYLDITYNGKRKKEYLKLYLVKANTPIDRENNQKIRELAESIRAKRQLELHNSAHGFDNTYKLDISVIEYFKNLMEQRKENKGNYGNWESALKHLISFHGTATTFRDVDINFVEKFKLYLQNDARTKSDTKLAQNSQSSYFNKFKACLRHAFEERIIPQNPARSVKGIKNIEPEKEFLSFEELKILNRTECKYTILKRAFLFACFTGLRWSDIEKMTWAEVQEYNGGHRLVFRQKKTKGQEYLDIGKQARNFLGEKGKPEDKVFAGLKYSSWNNVWLQKWVTKAGIAKEITFHCSRHTFAILQLELGTDIYTVSKLLGHSEIKTTQIYAKILDNKKKEAMNKFPDINL